MSLEETIAEADRRQRLLRDRFNEVNKRYFSWSLFEGERECVRDFEAVRHVRNSTANVFLEYVEKRNYSERSALVTALIKRLHVPNMLTPNEVRLFDDYSAFFNVPFHHPSGQVLSSTRVPDAQLRRQQRFLEAPPTKRAAAKALRKTLKLELTATIGRILSDTDQQLSYEKTLGDWQFVTTFEFGSRVQIRYSQVIYALPSAACGSNVSHGMSVLNWMGIAPQSDWSWILIEDVPEIASAISRVCQTLASQVDSFVTGLSNPLVSR